MDSVVSSQSIVASIICAAYNHEKYVAQAIEGFLMQKTAFPVEIIIHDDVSTDDTTSIIQEYETKYPEVIRAFYEKENQYSKGEKMTPLMLPYCRGEYIAICEGDDYWTDPCKLQKQVDFLEANPDYGLVHTDYDILIDKTNRTRRSVHKSENRHIPQGFVYEELLYRNFIAACTVCLRRNLIEKHLDYDFLRTIIQGDAYMWSEIAQHSKIGCVNDSTAVHRVLQESASHSLNEEKLYDFTLSALRLKEYLFKKYDCSRQMKERTLDRMNRLLLHHAFRLQSREIATNAFSYLSNNKRIGLVDRLLFCSVNNSVLYFLLKATSQLKYLLHTRIKYWG